MSEVSTSSKQFNGASKPIVFWSFSSGKPWTRKAPRVLQICQGERGVAWVATRVVRAAMFGSQPIAAEPANPPPESWSKVELTEAADWLSLFRPSLEWLNDCSCFRRRWIVHMNGRTPDPRSSGAAAAVYRRGQLEQPGWHRMGARPKLVKPFPVSRNLQALDKLPRGRVDFEHISWPPFAMPKTAYTCFCQGACTYGVPSAASAVGLSFFRRDSAHNGLNATRCLCVVFINASTSTVQFLEMRWVVGKSW